MWFSKERFELNFTLNGFTSGLFSILTHFSSELAKRQHLSALVSISIPLNQFNTELVGFSNQWASFYFFCVYFVCPFFVLYNIFTTKFVSYTCVPYFKYTRKFDFRNFVLRITKKYFPLMYRICTLSHQIFLLQLSV